MEEKKNVKNRWLHLRLDESEHGLLMQRFRATTERKLSAYARKILLGKPMIKGVRNQSLQEILATLTQLQKDLNGIGNNYNQMLKKLHVLSKHQEISLWIKRFEADSNTLFETISSVREYVHKTAGKWLQ